MFGALKRGFRSMASLILVRNVVGELQPKRTLAALRGFLAAARLSCYNKIFRGFRSTGGQNPRFPIDFAGHRNSSAGLPRSL